MRSKQATWERLSAIRTQDYVELAMLDMRKCKILFLASPVTKGAKGCYRGLPVLSEMLFAIIPKNHIAARATFDLRESSALCKEEEEEGGECNKGFKPGNKGIR